MRLFIAITLSEDNKVRLVDIQTKIKEKCLTGNFTTKDNFHLTIKFIGEINESYVEFIKSCVDAVALKTKSFDLSTDRIGGFPKGNKSIIWLGLQKDRRLGLLHAQLENCLKEFGIRCDDRRFTPHITFGRGVVVDGAFSDVIGSMNVDSMSIRVEAITLMESKRVEGELRYIPIYSKGVVS